jgi:hypothetical protein
MGSLLEFVAAEKETKEGTRITNGPELNGSGPCY